MKIVFPDITQGGSPRGCFLTLCGQGKAEGSFTGTVPVALKLTDSLTATSEKTVSVSSSTKTNRRGVRSGVIKVTMPYSALMPDGNGGYTSDPSRSGAEISVHIVVALPGNLCADLRGSDDVIQRNARLQAAAVAFLLSSVCQGLVNTPVVYEDVMQETHLYKVAPTSPIADTDCALVAKSAVEGSAGLYGVSGGFEVAGAGYGTNGTLKFGNDADFGGYDLAKGARALLGRIARNLPAIDGCEDVQTVAWKVDNISL